MKQEFLLVGFFILGMGQLVPVLADITFFEGDFNKEFIMTNDANGDSEQDGVEEGSIGSARKDASMDSKEDLNDIGTSADEKKFSGKEMDEKQKAFLFIAIGFLIVLIIFLTIRYIVLEHQGGYKK